MHQRKKYPDIRITNRNIFLLDSIDLKYCWMVARDMTSEIAILNRCYSDASGFGDYKWVTLNGSTIFEEKRSDLRGAFDLITTDQDGTSWKVYLIFNTRSFIEFISKWVIRKDNVLGDLGMLPPVWKGEIPNE